MGDMNNCNNITRRHCLELMGAASMAATFSSCTEGEGTSRAPSGDPAATPTATKTAFIYDPFFKRHLAGASHPENPLRCDAIVSALKREGIYDDLLAIAPRRAEVSELLSCHDADYVRTARRDVEAGLRSLSTGDTNVTADSYDAALLAAGGAITAVDAVFDERAKNAFCLLRPPGHHATATRGMGFCIFNNAALAARHAQAKYGVGRVLIVDWDVHHGNGTQDIFYADKSVFYFSTHQWPLYPGTGAAGETGRGEAIGTTLNCPFPRGAGRREILGAFEGVLARAQASFKPEFVVISAGFDSRIDDPLGGFTLTDADFTDLTRVMTTLADEYACGKVVAVLEGGYNLAGLGKATTAHVKALMKT